MEEVKVNSNFVNAKIKANILSDEEMKKIGFTNLYEPHWYYSRRVKFPKGSKYKDIEISFSVAIPKNGSDIHIDVLDEDFLQPYDYQKMISEGTKNEICFIVRDFVEEHMDYLQKSGVLSGHVKGAYI